MATGGNCPNGMCSRKQVGKQAPTYGQAPSSGKVETAVFAQG